MIRIPRTRTSSSTASAARSAQARIMGSPLPLAITLPMRWMSFAADGSVATGVSSPWRRALRLDRALPAAVRGPVLRRALRRLAAICRSLAMPRISHVGDRAAQQRELAGLVQAANVVDRGLDDLAPDIIGGRSEDAVEADAH